MRITDTHIYFWGGIFSNFFFIPITYKGYHFPTSEHAYMWEKAIHHKNDSIAEKILKAPHPRAAKALGREIPNFDKDLWDDVSYNIMLEINMIKWRKFISVLQLTGNKTLVEASPYDKIWGVGLSERDFRILDESQWKGKNLLGKVIMECRDNYKKEFGFDDPLNY